MNNLTKLILISLSSFSLLNLTGCAALSTGEQEFSCPGMPEETFCGSVQDAYAATDPYISDDLIIVEKIKETAEEQAKNKDSETDKKADTDSAKNKEAVANKSAEDKQQKVQKPITVAVEEKAVPKKRALPLNTISEAQNLRTTPQIMNLAINSWIDKKDILHSEQTLFIEMVPRQWKVGVPFGEKGTRLFPLNVQQSVPSSPSNDLNAINVRRNSIEQ